VPGKGDAVHLLGQLYAIPLEDVAREAQISPTAFPIPRTPGNAVEGPVMEALLQPIAEESRRTEDH
jgi:hypothetical protein